MGSKEALREVPANVWSLVVATFFSIAPSPYVFDLGVQKNHQEVFNFGGFTAMLTWLLPLIALGFTSAPSDLLHLFQSLTHHADACEQFDWEID